MKEESLNYREYNGLRGLAGVLSVLPYIGEGMKKRFTDMGQEYADAYERIVADVQYLFDGVVKTVPAHKRYGIKMELMHTTLDIRTNYAGTVNERPNWIMLKEDSFVKIAKLAQGTECEMCMKRGREVKNCKLRQLLNETLPYKVPEPADPTTCVYAEHLIETLEGKTVEEMMGEVKV